jgi:hypothetical protein
MQRKYTFKLIDLINVCVLIGKEIEKKNRIQFNTILKSFA